jgi:hypothetical protein
MTEEHLIFVECHIHKHNLFATSIAKAKELLGHAVNRHHSQRRGGHWL